MVQDHSKINSGILWKSKADEVKEDSKDEKEQGAEVG